MNLTRRVFRDKLSQIPEVEYVYSQLHEGVIRIWSVINTREKAVRNAIYEKETEILDEIPNVSLDFHVLVRENREIADIAPREADLVFSKD